MEKSFGNSRSQRPTTTDDGAEVEISMTSGGQCGEALRKSVVAVVVDGRRSPLTTAHQTVCVRDMVDYSDESFLSFLNKVVVVMVCCSDW